MSRLACDPQRLADLARILRSAQNEIELQIRLTEIGDLAIPQVHSYLQQSLNSDQNPGADDVVKRKRSDRNCENDKEKDAPAVVSLRSSVGTTRALVCLFLVFMIVKTWNDSVYYSNAVAHFT